MQLRLAFTVHNSATHLVDRAIRFSGVHELAHRVEIVNHASFPKSTGQFCSLYGITRMLNCDLLVIQRMLFSPLVRALTLKVVLKI